MRGHGFGELLDDKYGARGWSRNTSSLPQGLSVGDGGVDRVLGCEQYVVRGLLGNGKGPLHIIPVFQGQHLVGGKTDRPRIKAQTDQKGGKGVKRVLAPEFFFVDTCTRRRGLSCVSKLLRGRTHITEVSWIMCTRGRTYLEYQPRKARDGGGKPAQSFQSGERFWV